MPFFTKLPPELLVLIMPVIVVLDVPSIVSRLPARSIVDANNTSPVAAVQVCGPFRTMALLNDCRFVLLLVTPPAPMVS